jgi:hypothetical protein
MLDKPIDVVILSMLYPPDFGGMSSRAYNVAKALSKKYSVHVIASEPRYPSGKLNYSQYYKEWKDHCISVTRLPIPPIPYRGFVNRLILFTWYSILTFFALIKLKNVKAVISAYPHPAIDLTAKYHCGFEVDFSNRQLVTKAIVQAMKDKESLCRMRRNARQLAVDMLSEEKAMLNLNDFILRLITNHY